MTEVRYMISDVSRILEIPTNVLRYLEYCLSLNIKRTELGYRYYLQEDIDLLRNVRVLRDKGFHMKVIKSILPYIDKVKDLDVDKLLDLRERLEAALGLSGLEAQESLKAQYGKVIDINMEEGDLVYKDPATKQMTRLSTVTMKTEEVKIQPIAQKIDHSKSCEEVAAAASDVIMKESHMDEETANPSERDDISDSKDSFISGLKESYKDKKSDSRFDKRDDNKVTQIFDIKQAKPNHYMGAKKMEKGAPFVKDEDKKSAKIQEVNQSVISEVQDIKVAESKIQESQIHEVKNLVVNNLENKSFVVKNEKAIIETKTETKTEAKIETKIEAKPETKESGKNNSIEADSAQKEIEQEELLNNSKQMLERKSEDSLLSNSQDKIVQFREIMCSIVMDALRQNNHTLTNDINDTVTQSIVKEMDYMMRVREERQEERFRQLDRTIRETQIQRQQAAATKEGKKKKPSKFFQKNKVRI